MRAVELRVDVTVAAHLGGYRIETRVQQVRAMRAVRAVRQAGGPKA